MIATALLEAMRDGLTTAQEEVQEHLDRLNGLRVPGAEDRLFATAKII